MDQRPAHEISERCSARLVADGVAPADIRTLFVPGRIEVLGKHTDYCGGRSATCAIDRGFHVAFAGHDAPELSFDALDLNEQRTFAFSPDIEPAAGTWANYPMSVARRLARNFEGPLRGAKVAFTSTLPPAAGMSSSSAFIVATFLVLDALNGFAARAKADGIICTPFELAEYLGTLENGQSYRTLVGDRGVGTFGGSEDHTAITLGRAGRIGVYGYGPTRLEREVALPPGFVLAVASSGMLAEKTGAARERYNRAALLVRELVRLWNVDASPTETNLAGITRGDAGAADRLRAIVHKHVVDVAEANALLHRLAHFMAESETIIPAAMDALAAGKVDGFGEQVDRSQQLAHMLLGNQVPETRFLAASARQLGAAAASSFGAGFGGSVWAMIPREAVSTFLDAWRASYATAFPEPAAHATFFETSPAAGTAATIDPLNRDGDQLAKRLIEN